jgi:predicted ester cyclase
MSHSHVVRLYVEAMNQGDWAALRSLFAPDAQIRGVLGWGGIEFAMPVWRELHDGLSMMLEVEDIVESAETVVVRYIERGRFVGPFRGLTGLEPTGRVYEVTAIEWFEFEGGKIARRWGARDFDRIRTQVMQDASD